MVGDNIAEESDGEVNWIYSSGSDSFCNETLNVCDSLTYGRIYHEHRSCVGAVV